MVWKCLADTYRSVLIVLVGMFLALSAALSGGCERSGDSDGINWESNYQVGLQQAKQNNKAVLMVFSTTWCPPCNQMKKTTYKDSAVKAFVESKFVPIYLDSDKEIALSEKYGLQFLPTYYVLKSDGSEVGQFSGYYRAEAFVGELKKTLRNF